MKRLLTIAAVAALVCGTVSTSQAYPYRRPFVRPFVAAPFGPRVYVGPRVVRPPVVYPRPYAYRAWGPGWYGPGFYGPGIGVGVGVF